MSQKSSIYFDLGCSYELSYDFFLIKAYHKAINKQSLYDKELDQ